MKWGKDCEIMYTHLTDIPSMAMDIDILKAPKLKDMVWGAHIWYHNHNDLIVHIHIGTNCVQIAIFPLLWYNDSWTTN